MILSGHQPVYLPGIILFNKMALSDAFMYVGHVQFSPKSWQQRNRIVVNGGEQMLTVPVKKSDRFGQPIDAVELMDDAWRRKHLGSIRQAYGKRPFFDRYYPELEHALAAEHPSLGALNRAVIALMRGWLGITTPILESVDFPGIDGAKTEMLIQMCRAVGADCYLSNEGSRDYVDEAAMAACGITHCWQVFEHPQYRQDEHRRQDGRQATGSAFQPNLSAIDIVFNLGPDAGAVVRGAGHVQAGAHTPRMAA